VRKLLAVAARELRERWILFPASLVAGFFPLVLPAFGIKRGDAAFAGVFGAASLAAAAAVVIGSSMLARDAADGRLGFLFSRPLPWGAVWGGKWLAALVLVLGSGLLAAIPWMVAIPLASLGGQHGDSWFRAMLDEQDTVFVLLLILVGIGAASFNATAFRSRSPWLAADLALLLLAAWAIRRLVAPLFVLGLAGGRGASGQLLLIAPLAVGLVLASAFQLSVGRTDIRRGHHAMSAAFWATIAAALAVAAGYLLWVISAGPADLRGSYSVVPDPTGRWVYVEGRSSRGSGYYFPGLLLDSATGRYLPPPRLDTTAPWTVGRAIVFSADGRVAARWREDPEGRSTLLETLDLAAASPRAAAFTLESSPPPTWKTSVALSPSGGFALLVHESGASLFAVPSGRRVAAATIPPGWEASAMPVVSEAGARLWLVPTSDAHGGQRAGVRRLDIAVDGTSRLASIDISAPVDARLPWSPRLLPLAEGRRLLTFDGGVHLRDGATGALLATLAEGLRLGTLTVLADGRVVLVQGEGTRIVLRAFDPDGRPSREVAVAANPQGLSGGREVAPGRVVLGMGAPFTPGESLVVDVDDGRVVDRLPGLRLVPLNPWGWRVASDDVSTQGAVRSVQYFEDGEGHIIRIDFASGERKVLAGPGAPRGERLSVR
jgi:hypothetical protein